jgi:CubicO group peptidase (beta-lactamase class C family)
MQRAFAIVFFLSLASPAGADAPADFDRRVETILKNHDVPGAAIAIVEKGETVLARGYGLKRFDKELRVGPDTIFATGSTGKAFTTAALAILVDRRKIKWDDKVIDHLPGFRLWDPWVTREMTIRDLLVHRSGLGLGAGDLLFVPNSDRTRRESVAALRYIKPATSFRSTYAYDNVLYMVAGLLVEEVSGKSWEHFVEEEIFVPAGMVNSTVRDDIRIRVPDRALPHAKLGGPVRGRGSLQLLDEASTVSQNAAPAGSLAISARDMTQWLKIQLARGALPTGGARLFSTEQSAEMWRPVQLQPIAPRPPSLTATAPMFYTYALGWDVQDYRGSKVVWHGGYVFGYMAAVVLIPDKDVGFAIMINAEEGQVVRGLMYELLDHYLGVGGENWVDRLDAYKRDQTEAAIAALQSNEAEVKPVGPSLPLQAYTGTYTDPWYGQIHISLKGEKLWIEFPRSKGMAGELQHWQYDSFRARFTDRGIEQPYVTFSLNPNGEIVRIAMQAVSPTADFSYDYTDLEFTPMREVK